MTETEVSDVEQYFYRSATTSRRHRNSVSAYFVQRLRGSTVVARIEPLGLVHTTIGEQELALHRLRRNLVVSGSWQATPSRHHARIRVTTVRPENGGRPTTPQGSRGAASLVVETGVDPVTSRFSGARSTD